MAISAVFMRLIPITCTNDPFVWHLKAPQPRLDYDFFEGFLSTLSLDYLTVVCLSVYFYFAFHTNLRIGSAKSWLSRTQGSVAFLFLFILLFHCVCVFGFPFFHDLAVIHVVKPTASSVRCLRSTSKQPLPLKFV